MSASDGSSHLTTHSHDLESGTQGRIRIDPAGCRNRTVAGGLAAGTAPYRVVAQQTADRTRAARVLVDDCRAVSSAVIDMVEDSPVPRGRQASRWAVSLIAARGGHVSTLLEVLH